MGRTAFLGFILLLALLFGAVSARAADIGITLDGKKLNLSQPPVMSSGRVMVPFRGIAEALGAEVAWDNAAKKITMTKGTSEVEFTVGGKTAKINGRATQLDVAPSVINGVTVVPVRLVSEALGVTVNWTGSAVELVSGAKVGSFAAGDVALAIEGKEYKLMQDAKPLITALGKSGKVSMQETISCAYEGVDKLYSNSNAEVSALPINGKNTEIIDEIILKTNKYKTTKNVSVGAKKTDVIEAYGNDYTTSGRLIIYWAGEKNGLKTPRLYFEMSGDTVRGIGIYGGRNAG